MRHFALALVCLTAGWAQAPTYWTPELSLRVQSVGSVIPSPDGRLVAYTQTCAVMESEKSEQLTHIFLARADGSHRLQLTQGEKSCTAPSFSPDGRYVCFRSDRSGKQNIYRIPVDGGEAERLTDWKGELGGYEVSPDGKWIAFTAIEESKEDEKAKKEKLDFKVIDEKSKNHALWLIPVEPNAEQKRPSNKLVQGSYHITQFDWSPDSRFIAFEHQPTPLADDWTKADLSEVEIENGNVTSLAASGAAEANPHYSPDGQYLAFERTTDPPRWPGEARIVILPRQGGAPRTLAVTPDEQPNLLGWTADSAHLLFSETKHTRNAVQSLPIDGPSAIVYEPDRGTIGAMNVNVTGTYIGFARETVDEAAEAFMMPLAGGTAVRVSRANLDLPKFPIGETKLIRWKSKDGLEIEGLLTYPVGYEAGKRYPFILNIHGGPAGVFTESFIGRPGLYPLATFAAKGYAVLRANPRGSSGYGKQFRFANLKDWGGRDYEDLMAGVDHVIAMGVADPDRMAVMGWSYGGFMTSWVITQTKRFKAAVIGAAVTDLWSFTGTADIPSFLPDYFSGEPWDNLDVYRRHSPLSFVRGVTTPALILHGEADVRVPISQGFEFYHALKRLGVTTKMVTYPRAPHGPREPKFQLDIMNRHLDWLDKYVR